MAKKKKVVKKPKAAPVKPKPKPKPSADREVVTAVELTEIITDLNIRLDTIEARFLALLRIIEIPEEDLQNA